MSLPALADTFEQVRLDLDLARWNHCLKAVRDAILAEESSQRMIEREIDLEIGQIREQVTALLGEVERLEQRLDRLETSSQPLSDDELDDEDLDERAENAAFWAEWRQQRAERPETNGKHRPRSGNSRRQRELRERYRALARLIHPDLVSDPEARAHRENIMRLANEAFEAGDLAQIERLLEIWARADTSDDALPSLASRHKLLAQRRSEYDELRRHLIELERSDLGKLVRADARKRRRDIQREFERYRRELASLRMRRRRLLRTLDSRRQELSEISD
jgi:hypothetical protein